MVCEDNGWGISVPTPPGWLEAALATRPGIDYRYVDGADPAAVLAAAHAAADDVRARRRPVLLHLRTVRLFAHAGSDAELAYRKPRDLAADRERDPLLGTARALMAGGWTAEQVLQRYDDARDRVDETVERLLPVRRLHDGRRGDAPAHPAHPLGRDRARRPTGRRTSPTACPRRPAS